MLCFIKTLFQPKNLSFIRSQHIIFTSTQHCPRFLPIAPEYHYRPSRSSWFWICNSYYCSLCGSVAIVSQGSDIQPYIKSQPTSLPPTLTPELDSSSPKDIVIDQLDYADSEFTTTILIPHFLTMLLHVKVQIFSILGGGDYVKSLFLNHSSYWPVLRTLRSTAVFPPEIR